jgi:hypothetical protein
MWAGGIAMLHRARRRHHGPAVGRCLLAPEMVHRLLRESHARIAADVFQAKEATVGKGFSAVSAAFVRDPLPWKPRRDSRLQKQFRPVFACQAIPT